MGRPVPLARRCSILAVLLSILGFVFPDNLQAAVYRPESWFVSALAGYDVANPTALNGYINNLAPLQGLITGRIRAERGLAQPDWSHRLELGYDYGIAEGIEETPEGEIWTHPKNNVLFCFAAWRYLLVCTHGLHRLWLIRRGRLCLHVKGSVSKSRLFQRSCLRAIPKRRPCANIRR